ncbi:MAG: hypothetical protein U9N37_05480 [Thermodesulfobacteriota bacterium]|nr:hypothetical protein [Thermodesulfobacteriota bacterium]
MEEFESKLLPILRQGVAIIKMVFFRRLKNHISEQNPDRETSSINTLTGAVVNDIFGTPNTAEPFTSFVRENKNLIQETLKKVPLELVDMMVPLTDALRIQVLCDRQEGIDSLSILVRANELKLLLVPREIPLPANFMRLVRELGNKHDLLLPLEIRKMDS